ncbi:hypothetical protein [Methanosarcina sp. DH2]|jgi:uncharacterized ferredoxin-like protein|uniref:hypothetical protein n=1 Tax=Methanosarcina sp. DH2 TaxID=2605639 RepID=UPI0031F70D84
MKKVQVSFTLSKEMLQTSETPDVILIGVKASRAAGLNCGACGFETWAEMLDRQKVEV